MKVHFLNQPTTRREFLATTSAAGFYAAFSHLIPSYAWAEAAASTQTHSLSIAREDFVVNGQTGSAVTVNGSVPGPLLRFREGDEAVIQVTNKLQETTSIHWHGILLPPQMDGVPGVSFAGIKPEETFTYRFPVKQSGTYWYHSHSGGQELEGLYGPLIIDPRQPEPVKYDREFVVLLSDWSFMNPMTMIAKLKKQSSYFNYQKRTFSDFVSHIKANGFGPTVKDRIQWGKMRMDPTDLSDVTGATYTYLMNGFSPEANWTGVFKKGDRVRLRFIAAGAMTIFDVSIPGLKMKVFQADGQYIQPVEVEEFRIGPGETYDVIVELKDDKPYTVFAETLDRSGYALGTLATKPGLKGDVPQRRKRAVRTMDDMGMAMEDMPGMAMGGVKHGPDTHGPGNSAVPEETKSRLSEPGVGLENSNRPVLVYSDLQALKPYEDQRTPHREIELHLTGNMERYMWSIDGKKYSDAPAQILFRYGERLRITFVNDTMMEHPMHLHGMWMHLENGKGKLLPRKHTVIVKPAERLSVLVTADALGEWALHCHLLIHMEMGMFRVVRVAKS
ncbi:MAG: copper resistance protein CopA [Proteobacteria bacterium SG_bin7]|nr:MAG: copper resistance protein CopA [Proteobacteria bacterium SG_bin7]